MTKHIDKHEKEWNHVWEKNKKILPSIVNAGRIFYNKYFLNALLTYADKNTDFAELGCGTSTLIRILSPHVSKITGIDISNAALALSRQNCRGLKNVWFVKDDCTHLKTKSNQFDLVWSQGLIEHFDNPDVLINEHIRICKPGKTVLISVPYKYSYMNIWYLLTRPKLTRFLWPWTDQEMYTPKKFFKLIRKINFPLKNCSVYRINPLLGIVIFRITKE